MRLDRRPTRGLAAVCSAFALLVAAPTLVAGCGSDDGGVDEALEEIEDEVDDAREEIEDEIDDRT